MSETNAINDASNGPQWWISNQGTTAGPYSEAFILAGLKTNTLAPQTYACPVGGQEWKRLSEWPNFSSSLPSPSSLAPPPPPPPPPQEPGASAVAAPVVVPAAWPPEVIAWLGLLFSPVWAGIMTAVNSRRLGMSLPLWRPVVIGVGATVLDLLTVFLFDSFVVDLVLYLGALGLIWGLDLMPQVGPYKAHKAAGGRQSGWLVPGLAGIPAAVLVILTFIVGPLMPLGPRDVCQRFIDAGSLAEMKKYSTTKLWPALVAMDAHKNDPGAKAGGKDRFDLTDEAENPLGLGGHGVGYRMYWEDNGASHVGEGFFHLLDHGDGWKIDEWYFISYDSQQMENPVALSANYREMFSSTGTSGARTLTSTPTQSPGVAPSKTSNDKSKSPSEKRSGSLPKALAFFLMMILLGAARSLPAVLSGLAKLLSGPRATQGK